VTVPGRANAAPVGLASDTWVMGRGRRAERLIQPERLYVPDDGQEVFEIGRFTAPPSKRKPIKFFTQISVVGLGSTGTQLAPLLR
jgi:hypothetical protein